MVPHRKILQAIILAALSRRDSAAYLATAAKRFRVKFPGDPADFARHQVVDAVSAPVRSVLQTQDFSLLGDYRVLLQAAMELQIGHTLTVMPDGLDVVMSRLREHETIADFIDICTLCQIHPTVIIEDLRKLYGLGVSESDINWYTALFADVFYTDPDSWFHYEQCIGVPRAIALRKLMREPTDYVRWKLGVPVPPDVDKVLDRLICDAYYTEREMKSRGELSKDDLARIKMERDTIFKGLKMKQAIKESKDSAGGGSADVAKALEVLATRALTRDSGSSQRVLASELPE